MPDPNLEKLPRKSLIKMIENSIGSKAYNNFYVLDKSTGEEIDVLENGRLSCACFVSSILTIYGLIDCPHSTVQTVTNCLTTEYGWEETDEITPGNVVIWEKASCEEEVNNEHIGFVLNENEAISTSSSKREVIRHHITYGTNSDGAPTRKIVRIFKNTKI